jgi:hypothetical protein
MGWLFAFIALLGTWVLNFCITCLIGLSAFLVEDVSPFMWIYQKFIFILGGFPHPARSLSAVAAGHCQSPALFSHDLRTLQAVHRAVLGVPGRGFCSCRQPGSSPWVRRCCFPTGAA